MDPHTELDLGTTAPAADSTSPSSDSPGKPGRRSSRTTFTKRQLQQLEVRFLQQTFLAKDERRTLAEELGLTERQVMVWFQNRRGRLKRRGPSDSAYSQEKLQELNGRRPYPFLYGLLSTLQYRYPHPHPYHHVIPPTHAQRPPDNVNAATLNSTDFTRGRMVAPQYGHHQRAFAYHPMSTTPWAPANGLKEEPQDLTTAQVSTPQRVHDKENSQLPSCEGRLGQPHANTVLPVDIDPSVVNLPQVLDFPDIKASLQHRPYSHIVPGYTHNNYFPVQTWAH